MSLKFVPNGPINNIDDKQLSGPIMAYFTDATMRHSASMSYQSSNSEKGHKMQ